MGEKLLKAKLRKKLLAQRERLGKKFVQASSRRVCARLVAAREFRKAKNILFYYPVKNEVNCLAAMRKGLEMGKRVFLPRIRKWDFQIVEVKKLPELEKMGARKGTFGVPEPSGKRAPLGKIELVVVPAVAFDRRGGRIGYGGGYYDELLGKKEFKGVSIGACYSKFLFGELPSEGHDKRVDYIVCEEKVITCKRK